MQGLPQEILRLIASDLPREDLLNLRLVNKPLASAAAPSLFHTIALWIGIKSLENVTEIAEHPELSKHVKRIICSPVRFIDYRDKDSHEATIRDWFDGVVQSGTAHALAYGRYMSAYKGYIEAQTYLAKENLDITILALALVKLPNLESMIVDWSNDHIGSSEIIHAFGKFNAVLLLSFDCVHLLQVLFCALSASGSKLQHLQLGPSDQLMHFDVRDLSHVVFRRISRPRPASPQYSVVSHTTRIASQALTEAFHRMGEDNCIEMLARLRTLQIGEINVANDDPADLATIMTAVRQLISYSPSLETIELEPIEGSIFSNLPKPEMRYLIPAGGKLCRLRKLHTRGVSVTLPVVLAFLRDHATTLEDVELNDMSLIGGDWASALTQIREIKFLRLHRFILCYFDDPELDDAGEISVGDYILHVTDRNPILEDRVRRAKIEEAEEKERRARDAKKTTE